jgi:hypothetical protein
VTFGGFVVFVGEDAGVGVGGQHDAGVPELLLDGLQAGAGGVREAGRARWLFVRDSEVHGGRG